jgi:hypothetical protein
LTRKGSATQAKRSEEGKTPQARGFDEFINEFSPISLFQYNNVLNNEKQLIMIGGLISVGVTTIHGLCLGPVPG